MDQNYFKLLKEEKNQSVSLENRRKLANYQGRIVDHFRWEKKNQFLGLISSFLENKITIESYMDQFFELEDQVQESITIWKSNSEQLKAFEPSLKSEGFAVWIENLLSDIRLFEPDAELRASDEISEKEFRNGAEQFLPKIKEY